MSYIDQLLEGVVVEWKSLIEVVDCVDYRGKTPKKTTQGIFLVTAKNIRMGYIDYSASQEFISVDDYDLVMRRGLPEIGDVLITTEAPCGFVAQVDRSDIALAQRVIKYRSKDELILNNSFLKHYLIGSEFQRKLLRAATGSTVKGIKGSKLHKLTIPIPPLSVQKEIVRILDTFTELTTELTAELTARKKQYSYYRDQLLSFEEGEVEQVPLGCLAENLDSMRKPIASGLREPGNIPYYGASGVVDYVKDFIFEGDYLLVSEDGANLLARKTPIAFSISGKNWVNNHAHILKFETYVERKFVEYYLSSIDLAPYISGAAQPKLNKKNLNRIKIPDPAIEEKETIVSILDKFHTLTSSISEGLPKEIDLRKKQYEYYRDLLLTFPKNNVTA